MQLTFFSRIGWQDWDVAAEPAIPDRMPLLVDDDLILEDAGVPRPSVAANRWLRELPVSGAPSPGTWAKYARALRDWMTFLAALGIALFDTRDELKQALGAYAAHRASGPVEARWAATTWNQHISMLSVFYQWAVAEGLAGAVPFTYALAHVRYGDQVRRAGEPGAAAGPEAACDDQVPGGRLRGAVPQRAGGAEAGRDAGCGVPGPGAGPQRGDRRGLALATGLRRREFTFLLVFEVPPAPPAVASGRACRCCFRCRRRWPRAASTGPPGSTRPRCTRCTATSAWTGRRARAGSGWSPRAVG